MIEYVKADELDKPANTESKKGSRVSQLFNIKNDFWETRNIANYPENAALLKTMQKEMQEAAKIEGDDNKKVGYGFDFWKYY